MTIAAVDIGSNATRLTVSNLPKNSRFHIPSETIEKLRFPCRLGSDVFKLKKIGAEKADEMRQIFLEIKETAQKHKVDKLLAVATSAFRDAENGPELLEKLSKDFSIPCKILSGFEEASYMSEGLLRRELFDPEHTHLHMDIGGGSLELSAFEDNKFIFQESLDVGALRLVECTKIGKLKDCFSEQLNLIDEFLNTQNFKFNKKLKAFGTGGNFKRIGSLKVEHLKKNDENYFSSEDVKRMIEDFKAYPGEELSKVTFIKQDNAALILPSLMIIKRVLKFWPAERIEVPQLSLSHTILDGLI